VPACVTLLCHFAVVTLCHSVVVTLCHPVSLCCGHPVSLCCGHSVVSPCGHSVVSPCGHSVVSPCVTLLRHPVSPAVSLCCASVQVYWLCLRSKSLRSSFASVTRARKRRRPLRGAREDLQNRCLDPLLFQKHPQNPLLLNPHGPPAGAAGGKESVARRDS